MKIGGLVVAAGYGSCRSERGQPFPKVLEEIDGVTLVERVVSTVTSTEIREVAVVINPLFEGAVRQALAGPAFRGDFIVQTERTGAAEAVRAALPWMANKGIKHVLVIYADMPLWSIETVERLVLLHRDARPTISMVTVPLAGAPPELGRYGRIIRGEDGGILRIVEPADATEEELAAETANPSLWIFESAWLARNLHKVVARERPDGRAAEKYLPPLVGMAAEQGRMIAELPLRDPREALGVNNFEELKRVRQMLLPVPP